LKTRRGATFLLLVCAVAPRMAAQAARVNSLAALLGAEDARAWDSTLFARAITSRDSLVRRTAVIAAGRIGDRRATALVAARLADPAPDVQARAAFALGLLRDSTSVAALVQTLTGRSLDSATAAEVATALARIGGLRARAVLSRLLDGDIEVAQTRGGARGGSTPSAAAAALLEAWRLGPDAPVAALRRHAADTVGALRWPAVFSLSRLRAPEAAPELLVALDDPLPVARAFAARAFSKGYVEKAGLARDRVTSLLAGLTGDPDAGVRINALLTLATFRDSALAAVIITRLSDSVVNVRAQAATALGALGGAVASARLAVLATDRTQAWAVQRNAMVALAANDAAAFGPIAGAWRASPDWRDRAAAAEGWVAAGRQEPAPWLADPEPRVLAAGLQAWSDAVPGPDSAFVAVARPLIGHRDAAVRSLAADALARVADPLDVPELARMYAATGRDSFPNAALSALKALAAVARTSDSGRSVVEREFLARTPRPDDYQLRWWAEREWPAAAARWGPAYPVATGRTAAEYRAIVRRRLLGGPNERHPHVRFVGVGYDPVEVELLGPEAPLTVEHFLALVDRRFFDGNRWHRVVPNFVVQDGDPRGDGWGGPPGAIRDELNPVRYSVPVLGMALDGPDSGNSQWFINLSPQPHLDGTYTVFGRVVAGDGLRGLGRIAQGDTIVAIRRAR
jgi:cyclophilin family peptidyl-prolyl cis-trans isomerase/HEAT repeat protein